MTKPEPTLGADDRAAWEYWCRVWEITALHRPHRSRVESARRVLRAVADTHGTIDIMWSGGKDSTCLAHLAVHAGVPVRLVSEKDDLDYPGEREYITQLANEWGAELVILTPEVSPVAWLDANCESMAAGTDIHGRHSGLSKSVFFSAVKDWDAHSDNPKALGLRAAESGLRRALRDNRGRVYRLKSGKTTCHPIMNWHHNDVYAYALSHEIELMPPYRCIGLQHRENPWDIRKSWWLPGSNYGSGQYAWLRHYYPSLFRRARAWFPDLRRLI